MGIGEADGAVALGVEEETILSIRRRRILGSHMVVPRGGGRGSGLERWAAQQQDIWLGIGATGSKRYHEEAEDGLAEETIAIMVLLGEVVREHQAGQVLVPALVHDMKARDLDPLLEDRWCIEE